MLINDNKIHKGMSYLMCVLLLAVLIIGTSYNPNVTRAAACPGQPCFNGDITDGVNQGSGAQIFTVDPNLALSGSAYRASYVLILSLGVVAGGADAFVQTGTAKTANMGCGSPVVMITEYIDRVVGDRHQGTIKQHCEMAINPAIGSTHAYTQEYDSNTSYWCHDYDGVCRYSEPFAGGTADIWPTGFSRAGQVSAYAETNDNTVQSGSAIRRTMLSLISYKSINNNNFYYFTLPPINPGAYSFCNANCPGYHHNPGAASGTNIWFEEIWTT